jgi:hypothetical protein
MEAKQMFDFIFNPPPYEEFIRAITKNETMYTHYAEKWVSLRRKYDTETAVVKFYRCLDSDHTPRLEKYIEDWCKKRRSGERNG